MERFLIGVATEQKAEELVEDCLRQIGQVPPEANLGFIYATDRVGADLGIVLDRLQEALPGIHWVGSLGIGLCTTAKEIYEQPALSVMIGAFPDDSFRIIPRATGGMETMPADLAAWWRDQAFCFGLIHGDPAAPTPTILAQVVRDASNSFINGGLTSAEGTDFQVCDGLSKGGISGVLFNERTDIATDHTQGCSPIGPVHALTESRGYIAIRLDERPALEVMKTDIGNQLANDLRRLGGVIFAALPVPASDTGDYLVRNLIGIDEDHGLIAVGDDLDGCSQLMFCRRDTVTAKEDLQRMLDRLKNRTGDRPIRGGVYISCLGRGRYQFGNDSQELKMIRDSLGDFPLVGFFANGEIYNGRLYGYTGVLTLFL